jgi:hypothetical protein
MLISLKLRLAHFYFVSSFLSCLCARVRKHMMLLLQTIGQAYEDMQTQNQHLQQQVADRDDFNIKVRSIFLLMQTLPAFWALHF